MRVAERTNVVPQARRSLKLHHRMLIAGLRLGEAVRGQLARDRLEDHPEGELDAVPLGVPLDLLESGLRRVVHGRVGTVHFDRIAHRQLLEGGSGWTRTGRGSLRESYGIR